MKNYSDAGIELTLIDGSKIDFYPSGLITGQDETYLPPFSYEDRNEVERELEKHAYKTFRRRLLNNLYIRCHDYSIHIDYRPCPISIPYFSPLPQSSFVHCVDMSDLSIPVTRMSKPSSNGEIISSQYGTSGKIETDSFVVREQREAIKEARKILSEKVDDGENVFNEGMDKLIKKLPEIKDELVNAGKKQLNLLSEFYKVSTNRPLWCQVAETSSQRDKRWMKFTSPCNL